jgi:hypothetical protein
MKILSEIPRQQFHDYVLKGQPGRLIEIQCERHGLRLITFEPWLDSGEVICSPRWRGRMNLEMHWTGKQLPGGYPSKAGQSLAWTLPSPQRQNSALTP